MPINQYDNPVRYEYKPLGLDKLVAPMAAMQQKFDITQSTIDNAEFKLQHTPWGTDPTRAKAIISEFEKKRDEIANDLMITKNFRKASQQLTSLNKAWTKNPEAVALATNYTYFKERDEEERQRWLKGDTDKEAYDIYREDDIRKYAGPDNKGGANFSIDESGTEKYTSISRHSALNDMSKDFDDTKIKLMEMSPEEITSFFHENGFDGDTGDKKFVEGIKKSKKEGKLSADTEAALRSLTRFKDWAQQGADLEYLKKYGSGTPEAKANSEQLITSTLSSIDNELIDLSKKYESSKKPNWKELLENDPTYLSLINNKEIIEGGITEKGVDPVIVKSLSDTQYTNNLYDSRALAKLMKYNNVTSKTTFRSMPKETSSGGGGGNSNADLFANAMAGWKEAGYNPVSIKSLNQRRYDAAGTLLPGIKTINDIGDGVMRTVVLGKKGSEERKKMQGNVAGMYAKQERVISLRIASSNVSDFNKAMWKNGFSPTWEESKKLFYELNNNTLSLATDIIEKNRSANSQYVSAVTVEKQLDEKFLKDPSFLADIENLGNDIPQLYKNQTTYGPNGEYLGKPENVNKLFKVSNYSPEQLKKHGISIPSYDRESSSSTQSQRKTVLTYNEVARLNGYKDTKTALAKGFKFGGVSHDITEVKQKATNNLDKKESMTYQYTNDPVLEKGLSKLFEGSTFEGFEPAYGEKWENIPGFGKDGKPNPGTIAIADAKFATQSGNIIYRAGYKYKNPDGDGMLIGYVPLEPKLGGFERNQMILDYLDQSTNTNSKYKIETKELIKTLKFDQSFGNTLTESYFEAQPAKKATSGYRPPVLKEIPYPGAPGSVIQIVKVKDELNQDKVQLQVKNEGGKIEPILNEKGQIWQGDNVKAAKVELATQLDL